VILNRTTKRLENKIGNAFWLRKSFAEKMLSFIFDAAFSLITERRQTLIIKKPAQWRFSI